MAYNPTKSEVIECLTMTAAAQPAEPTEPDLDMGDDINDDDDDGNSSCTSVDYESTNSDVFLYAIHPAKEISELVDVLNTSEGFTLDGYRESHMKFNHNYNVINVGRFDSKRITLILEDDEDQLSKHCLYAVLRFTTKIHDEIFRINEMFKQLFLPHMTRFDKIQVSFAEQGAYKAPKILFNSVY